ncbi:MAG TPA: hypothetical protein VN924_04275 [Bryobacteraceae bacterium]|jgi:hypothetical protein|nr:hypothetical protein [Bryobacteraceae bacterium]
MQTLQDRLRRKISTGKPIWAALTGVLCFAGCGNQSTTPPTAELTYTSGSTNSGVAGGQGLPVQHVSPDLPISLEARGFSSLSGMQSLEIDPVGDLTYTCIQGEIGQSSDALLAPTKTVATGTTTELDLFSNLTAPKANCNKGYSLSNWSVAFTATALSKNGLKTTTKTLSLQSP